MGERTDIQELIKKYRRLCRSEKGKAFAMGIFGGAAVAFLIYGLAMIFSIISDNLWGLSFTVEFFCIAAITIIILLISAACLALIWIPVSLYQDVRNTITADEIAGFVDSIEEDTFVEIQGPPLKFESMRTLDVDFSGGKGTYVGAWSIAEENEVGILTSIYGDDGPTTVDSLNIDIPLSAEGAEQWRDMTEPDNIRLPYIDVSLFDIWEFAIVCKTSTEEIYNAFDAVCRAIALDIVRNRLTEAVDHGKTIKEEYYTEQAIAPYFMKDFHGMGSDAEEAMSGLLDIIQPILDEQEQTVRKYLTTGGEKCLKIQS